MEAVEQVRDLAAGALEARQDPAILDGLCRAAEGSASTAAPSRIRRDAFQSLFARSSPCLTRCGSSARPGGGHRQQAEAQGVGAVSLDLVQRVDPVPRDFDIRLPSGDWMIELIGTSLKGYRR